MRRLILILSFLLALAVRCLPQGLSHSPAFRAAAAGFPTGQRYMQFDAFNTLSSTNGGLMSYAALTNSGAWATAWGVGTWLAQNTASGAATTNIDQYQCDRFCWTNAILPPSPYSHYSVNGTNFGGAQLPTVLQYNSLTNASINPTEVVIWKLPFFPTNIMAVFDFQSREDNKAGQASSMDKAGFSSHVGSSTITFNYKRGLSGVQSTTNGLAVQAEVGTNSGGLIYLVTNNPVRVVMLGTNGGGCIWVYDLANNYNLLGVSTTNGQNSTSYDQFEIGQWGHAATADFPSKALSWFWNVGITVSNLNWSGSVVLPPAFALQWEPSFQPYIQAFVPIHPADWPPQEYADRREWLPGETVYVRKLQ